jgi:hypothetical protein
MFCNYYYYYYYYYYYIIFIQLLYGKKLGPLKARDSTRKTAAEMKCVIKTVGYTWADPS